MEILARQCAVDSPAAASHRVGCGISLANLDQTEQPPPVHCAVQDTDNRDAVGSWAVENQYVPEIAGSPFSGPDELWATQHDGCAHFRLGGEVGKALFCSHQEAISNCFACNPGELDVMIDQVLSRRGTRECTPRHDRFFFAPTLASPSLRIAAQSSLVSGDSSLSRPSSSKASRRSSALRFSSSRISSRTCSLTLL